MKTHNIFPKQKTIKSKPGKKKNERPGEGDQKTKEEDKNKDTSDAGPLHDNKLPDGVKKEEDQITNQDNRITNQEELITKD